MKKILSILFVLFPFLLSAQDIYIKASGGAGIGNAHLKISTVSPNGVTSYKGELAVGLQVKNLRLEAGLGYVNDGYKLGGLVFENNMLYPGSYTDLSYAYKHFYIPARLGYDIHIAGGLSITPYAGFNISFNSAGDVTTEISEPHSVTTSKASGQRGTTLLAEGILYATYRIGSVDIMAGPSYRHSLNSIIADSGIRLHSFTGDIGIAYHF